MAFLCNFETNTIDAPDGVLVDDISPFIIEDKKAFYYRGLREWKNEKGCLFYKHITSITCYNLTCYNIV